MGDDGGGIVERIRSLLGRKRRAAVPPGRAVFTASDLPASLVPPTAQRDRDEPARAEPVSDEQGYDEQGYDEQVWDEQVWDDQVYGEPSYDEPGRGVGHEDEPATDAGTADEEWEPAAEEPRGSEQPPEAAAQPRSFLDLDLDLDLDALYEDLDPVGPSTPEPLFAGRSPATTTTPVDEEPAPDEAAAEERASADVVEQEAPVEEDDAHRTLRDLADELARFAERDAVDTPSATDYLEPEDAEVEAEPASAAAAAPHTEPVEPPEAPRDEGVGLFDAHPRSEPAGRSRQARVHDDRLERRSAPMHLTPSEAVRLAEDGPNALRRRSGPVEDR